MTTNFGEFGVIGHTFSCTVLHVILPVGRWRISPLDCDLPHQLFEILVLLCEIIVLHTVRGALEGERGRGSGLERGMGVWVSERGGMGSGGE